MRMIILCGLKLLVLTLWFILLFFTFTDVSLLKKNIENALKANKQTKHPFFLLTCPQ